MSGNHTAGPWGVNLDDHILPRVIRMDGSGDIARVKLSDDDMRESVTSVPLSAFDEADANARLIAAAPDLLEEAELAVRVLLQAEKDAVPYYERTVNGLRAAIAKAKGEEVAS